jgi:S1-C subfamily serine protease
MLNLQGQVIGVVSAKMVGVAVEGIGFAISANTVNMYLPRLEAGETIMAFN